MMSFGVWLLLTIACTCGIALIIVLVNILEDGASTNYWSYLICLFILSICFINLSFRLDGIILEKAPPQVKVLGVSNGDLVVESGVYKPYNNTKYNGDIKYFEGDFITTATSVEIKYKSSALENRIEEITPK